MKRKIYVLLIIFSTILIHSQADLETNFLQGYLNFENFFLQLSGDYGTSFFPFLNLGYGGRDIGMSGAFTGVADDIGTLEKNPAGTASLKYTELFFSHNKILGDVNYDTLGYSMRFNDLGFGFGARVLYLPFDAYDKFGDITGSGIISYSVYTLNASYNFLRSYKFFGLSVGANVKLFVYSVPENIYKGQTRVNVTFDIGLLTRFNLLKFYQKNEKNFSIGFAVRNIGPWTDNEPPPTVIALGLAYKPIEEVLISLDGEMLINYSSLTYKNWSVKTGVEWRFAKIASLLAGVTIKSNPSFSLGINLNFEDFTVNMVYNPDFSDFSRFSIGASIRLGDFGRSQKDDLVKKFYADGLKLMNEGNYKSAIDVFEKVLDKDYTYTPAKEALEICIKQIDIERKLNNLLNENKTLE